MKIFKIRFIDLCYQYQVRIDIAIMMYRIEITNTNIKCGPKCHFATD